MIVFPNAKINIGLFITGKRSDGYHDLASCFYPVPWHEVLEVVESDQLSFESSGFPIPGKAEDNLCLKAYQLLAADHELPPVKIHLLKKIPIGAGLGGGSADATFMLKACNQLFDLKIDDHQLEIYAGKLGSDCPFFVKNQPVIARGTGNVFEPVELDLHDKYLVMVNPNLHVSTAEAYGGLQGYSVEPDLKEWLQKPLDEWKNDIRNDFEASVFKIYPAIRAIKKKLYELGAKYASMSGSGATVFGIFDQQADVKRHFPPAHQVKGDWM